MSGQPEDTSVTDSGRCAACGARVSAEQAWCTLCLRPLSGQSPNVPHEAEPEVAAPIAGPEEPNVGPEEPIVGPEQPKKGLPPGVAEAMLAELSASTAAERPLARGPLAGTSRGVRSAIGCGAALILIAILIGLLTLVGLLL